MTGELATEFYVAPTGADRHNGSRARPFATLARAQAVVRQAVSAGAGPIHVYVRAGTYYLDQPLVFGPEDASATQPVTYQALPGEAVTLSGGLRLDCAWRPYRDGIWQCDLPQAAAGALNFTQLFVN